MTAVCSTSHYGEFSYKCDVMKMWELLWFAIMFHPIVEIETSENNLEFGCDCKILLEPDVGVLTSLKSVRTDLRE